MNQHYTYGEELTNSLTHGIGAVLSIAGLAVLILSAALYGNVWHVVSFSIYGVSLLLLYSISTLYHGIRYPVVKKFLRFLDHSAIFILIAGSYTPFVLVSLRGGWGWSIFGIVWTCAIIGIILKSILMDRFKKLSIAVYVVMGWLCLIALKEIIGHVPPISIVLLLLGGLFYTSGVVFYAWRRLPYHHAVWHVFVLIGSLFHYFAVLALVGNI
jgi:hemolysin III